LRQQERCDDQVVPANRIGKLGGVEERRYRFGETRVAAFSIAR
jgi:hypothetical protein